LCLNSKIVLTGAQVSVLSTFAQVPIERQREWLPCLKQMHSGKTDQELCDMLMSYQSECRLLLLQVDSTHKLNRINKQMTIEWTSDPDISVILGKDQRIY
jgi:hypothetical protein